MVMTINSPVGVLTLREQNGALARLDFGNTLRAGETQRETELLYQAARQLGEYFAGARKSFDIPLAAAGTTFQKMVWQALCRIPYGQTRSYKDIAIEVGSPKAFRAVGLANNRNPLAIVVPCHRVLGANGSLTGYAGGLDTKRFLLELEREHI